MNIHATMLTAALVAVGLGCALPFSTRAHAGDLQPLQQVQYDRYQDRNGDGRYDRDRRDDDRDFRHEGKWRPGEVLPPPLLNRVVGDWEDRGLNRPPDGHEWVRVREQFILVRVRDRMIARVLNFD